jgi:peptide/nickel transport system substrate-binding protein
MSYSLQKEAGLVVERTPGTIYQYLALNLRDPTLKDERVRQALAYSINVEPLIHYLWRDMARPAESVLPTQSWAFANQWPYKYDPAAARKLLDEAGYPARNGVRFHLSMKTSTEETTRLLAAVLQQQLRDVGIILDIRTFEFATFFSDVTKGAYQLYSLRWIGGNNDPDIFEYAFQSARMPPKGANRSYYSNGEVDQLVTDGRKEIDQQKRAAIYARVQQDLAHDLPYIHLWYLDNVIVHSKRVRNIELSPPGNYDFLTTAELAP